MTSVPRGALVAALGAACLLQGHAAAAGRDTVPVVGVLTVAVTPATVLSVAGSTGTGSLGSTSVVDTRTGSVGYLVSVSTAGFDLVGPPITSAATTHIPNTAASVRVTGYTGGTPSSTTSVALPSVSPVFQLVYPSAVGLLPVASTYTLSLTVAIPSAAAVGSYAGTVTQSVV